MQTKQAVIDTLAEICRHHRLPDLSCGATIEEPYIPYIPENWNGVLVLGEAQNHGTKSAAYLIGLRRMGSETRIHRMRALSSKQRTRWFGGPDDIGVQPWDDGSLKLAVEAALKVRAEEVAVSNAVLWSAVDKSGRSQNPSLPLIERSVEVWSGMLPALSPTHIVTSGRIAERTVREALERSGFSPARTTLGHPSAQAMSRMCSLFQEDDLLQRYPEVRKLVEAHPEWVTRYRKNKVLFACHAVSAASCQAL